MGAKTWMLVASEGPASEILKARPALDREATAALAQRLFPGETLKPLEDGSLGWTSPPNSELVIGCFPGLVIVAAKEFGGDYPSRLDAEWLSKLPGDTHCLHAMHSVVDWFAFAVWKQGRLVRALSLSPDSGLLEDIGDKLAFELRYWAGAHPAVEPGDDPADYPFIFHPLDLGEAALRELFGYQLEGEVDAALLNPESIPLLRFHRHRSLWKRLLG